MAGKFQFDLISPEKIVFSAEVEEVNIPGSEGYFSVLAGHMPLMTRAVPGSVHIRKSAGEAVQFIIFGGLIEVKTDKTSLLAESAVPLARLDKQDIERRIAHARNLLKDVRTEDSRSRLEEFIYHMSAIKSAEIGG
ncbi:MAG: F0F1 ATP synthase subunit epsilon [Candidatus Tokpelaia sp.]|uniref:F0F1 ATP synthase subunit epsilon n=1 Tax=Candidatus Tokpelaia sp. TaxID=2233777 RepID=UPI00123A1D18|nr:F0F1 ATP synthase subunit epsilon [Candidatus Tokpelaia sp.]KAA6205646.1 MAG: F0F1 ATP synthase subunit epsilon [Candidatus Tokpelaia sp.]KAA6207261.1 MAG: F0F1 ATP synthase subunit epsilon [Candidatus Tokpelaia sp.]KAA6405215.1 F0F1 ATP synthase subunit epsilon [Candidatus Tokpelaia sp.]